MPKLLTDAQIRSFRDDGYVCPVDCISPADATALRERLEGFEAESGLSLTRDLHFKTHLYFAELTALAQNPAILDAVEDLIGPDILVFASNTWIKGPRDGKFVSWHQDSAYFGLEPHDEVTAWIALSDSTPDSGCMRVIPGSHVEAAHSHVETFHADNLLARGQRIDDIDEDRAVDLNLRAGQYSLHHERAVHGSLANRTDHVRFGYALFYIPAATRSTIGRRPAWLVRGEDRHGHWDADPMPEGDRDPKILAHMRACYDAYVSKSVDQEAATGMHR